MCTYRSCNFGAAPLSARALTRPFIASNSKNLVSTRQIHLIKASQSMPKGGGKGGSKRGQVLTGGKTTPENKKSEKDLKCSVCLDLYQDPFLLPCLHTFCQKCLEGILRKSKDKSKKTLTCPQCQKDHSLPEDGLAGFPPDQALANEVQTYSLQTGVKSSSDIKPNQCTMCTEDDPATSYCATCGKYLCDFCHKAHKRQVDFRSHKVTSLSELSPHDILAMEKPLHCRSHAGEVLKLYCKTCNKLICRDCTIVDHRSHEYGFNSDLRPVVQEEVNIVSSGLKQKQKDFEEHEVLIQTTEKDYKEYSTDLEDDITTTFNGYIKEMEARRDELLQQMQTSKQTDMKQIWAQKEFVETTLSGITSALRYADRLCGCSSDTTMLAMRSEATAHFDSLHSAQWDATRLKLSLPYRFYKNNVQVGQFGQLNQQASMSVSGPNNISLGDKIALTVQTNYIPKIVPPISITMQVYNYNNGYNRQLNQDFHEYHDFTLNYVKKGEWKLEILPTRSGQYTVKNSRDGTMVELYRVYVSAPLKVGSRVHRGPYWNSGNDDGGAGSEGTVTYCNLQPQQPQYDVYGYNRPQQQPQTTYDVGVTWTKTGQSGVYQFDERKNIFQIDIIPLGSQ